MKQKKDLVLTYAKLKSLYVKPNAKEKLIVSKLEPLTDPEAQFPEEYGKEVANSQINVPLNSQVSVPLNQDYF